jgi:hypothetical protein
MELLEIHGEWRDASFAISTYNPHSSLACLSMNFIIVLLISLFNKLILLTSKLFLFILIKAFKCFLSASIQVTLYSSTPFLADSLSDLFDVILSHFKSNSNGFKVIRDRSKLNFACNAVLNDLLAHSSNKALRELLAVSLMYD